VTRPSPNSRSARSRSFSTSPRSQRVARVVVLERQHDDQVIARVLASLQSARPATPRALRLGDRQALRQRQLGRGDRHPWRVATSVTSPVLASVALEALERRCRRSGCSSKSVCSAKISRSMATPRASAHARLPAGGRDRRRYSSGSGRARRSPPAASRPRRSREAARARPRARRDELAGQRPVAVQGRTTAASAPGLLRARRDLGAGGDLGVQRSTAAASTNSSGLPGVAVNAWCAHFALAGGAPARRTSSCSFARSRRDRVQAAGFQAIANADASGSSAHSAPSQSSP
jgi:hypothetical protein